MWAINALIKNNRIIGIAIGGEEEIFDPPYKEIVINASKGFKSKLNLKVWANTKYNFKYLMRNDPSCLKYIDVLIDGPYMEQLDNTPEEFPNLKISLNQRIIDVQKSIKENKIVLWKI